MQEFDLDTILIGLKSNSRDDGWTARNAVEGVQIFGGIGSGKTSGSGKTIALKYLKAGFGGLVLTTKPDEKDDWKKYCTDTGRSKDLLVIEPGSKNYFNFLDYESRQLNGDQSVTENIVQVLKTVIHASEEKSTGKSDDAFWETALDMLIFNVIDLCKLGLGRISIQDMFDLVQTVPKTDKASEFKRDTIFYKAFEKSRSIVHDKIEAWEQGLDPTTLNKFIDQGLYEIEMCNAIPDARILKYLDQFFFGNFITLSEKTRSIIDFSFSGFLFRLLRDPVYTLFCRHESNFLPDDCLRGRIILINLPVKVHDKVGRDAQIMFKYIWQRAMERQSSTKSRVPVFLWADEAQNFLHEHDAVYQATARSSCICTVYITQNLSNYYASMGGQKAEYKVQSFLGTLNTKIFHANADIETNKYASELIGESEFERQSISNNVGMSSPSKTVTTSSKSERTVKPEDFLKLKTGSKKNGNCVEGYFHRPGNLFANGKSFIKMEFDQNSMP